MRLLPESDALLRPANSKTRARCIGVKPSALGAHMQVESGRLLRNENRMALLRIDKCPTGDLRADLVVLAAGHRKGKQGDERGPWQGPVVRFEVRGQSCS